MVTIWVYIFSCFCNLISIKYLFWNMKNTALTFNDYDNSLHKRNISYLPEIWGSSQELPCPMIIKKMFYRYQILKTTHEISLVFHTLRPLNFKKITVHLGVNTYRRFEDVHKSCHDDQKSLSSKWINEFISETSFKITNPDCALPL